MLSNDELRRLGAEMQAEREHNLAHAWVTDADLNQDAEQGTERLSML